MAVMLKPWLVWLAAASVMSAASVLAANPKQRYASTCETIPAELHITKDEYDSNSVLLRTCEESVAVNKCEGACASSIKPSAIVPGGFQKDCHCCRESSFRRRSITLTNCFDAAGSRLTGDRGVMAVTVNEPVDCKCHECGKRPS